MRVATEKQKRFGKKLATGKENRKEKERKDEELARKIELAEMKANLWKCYRDKT